MKLLYTIILLCLLSLDNLTAQIDTITNRYATLTDEMFWPSVNEGDFIFFRGNNDGGESIYYNGTSNSITLPIGKKILIWRGAYRRIYINGSNCVNSSTQPTIVTNLGGQVKWGYSEANNHYRTLELFNFEHLYLSGKYDSINQTGHPNYLGHNDGNSYDDPNFHGKYGLWGNPKWSGQRYWGGFSNIVTLRNFKTCKVDYVAASEGGFAGFNVKTDNPTVPGEVEVDIQDCFAAMTESEGFYISWSTGAINQHLTKLTLRNNIMAFNGTEPMQTDNLIEGSLIEHNVGFVGACFFRRPFQDLYQDGLHQFSFSEGGITVQNNAMITGNTLHDIRYKNAGAGRVIPDSTKKVLMKNNYYGFARSNISYVWEGDGITPYVVDSNVYGPVSTPSTRDAYTTNYGWNAYYRLCNNTTPITFKNTIYPQGRPLYEGFCGQEIVDTTQNSVAEAPLVQFVNSGFSDTTDYRNITYWSATYTTVQKNGIFIPYQLGDCVFYDDTLGNTHFFRCIQAHAGNFDPYVSPTYWSQISWNGNRLPPLDLRMVKNSYYDQRCIGLLYKDPGTTVGIKSVSNFDEVLTIYPNPADRILYFDSDVEIANIIFVDIMGKEVGKVDDYELKKPVDVTAFSDGIYLARVTFINGNVLTKKVVVQ